MALLETLPEEVENSLRELRKIAENEVVEIDDLEKKPNSFLVSASKHATISQNGAERSKTNGAISDAVSLEKKDLVASSDALAETDRSKEEIIAAEAAIRLERPIIFATDVTDDGVFGEEWLVVDDKQVYVFSKNGGNKAKVRYNIPIETIKEAKAETHIGNGQIELRTDTETISLIRYSQATVREANTIARKISSLAKGEPAKEEKVEAIKKLCPKCKRVLPEDSDVCPGCVNKRMVMLRLFKFMKPYKALVVWNLIVMFTTTILGLVGPLISGRIIDILNKKSPSAYADLYKNVGIMVVATLGLAVCGYFGRRINAFLGTRISMDIRIAVYDKFTQLSLGYYDKIGRAHV